MKKRTQECPQNVPLSSKSSEKSSTISFEKSYSSPHYLSSSSFRHSSQPLQSTLIQQSHSLSISKILSQSSSFHYKKYLSFHKKIWIVGTVIAYIWALCGHAWASSTIGCVEDPCHHGICILHKNE